MLLNTILNLCLHFYLWDTFSSPQHSEIKKKQHAWMLEVFEIVISQKGKPTWASWVLESILNPYSTQVRSSSVLVPYQRSSVGVEAATLQERLNTTLNTIMRGCTTHLPQCKHSTPQSSTNTAIHHKAMPSTIVIPSLWEIFILTSCLTLNQWVVQAYIS